MTQEQQKFYDIKTYSDYDVVGFDVDYKVFVNHGDKEVVIQFEESDSKLDWINNILFFPFPLLLDKKLVWTTLGYSIAYASTNNKPMNEFCSMVITYFNYKVVIRGWSFGSAMAKIFARHFVIRTGRRIDELTTFGDVKCWLNPFYSVSKYCSKIRNYVCRNDLVTMCVPFFWRDKTCCVGDKFSFKKILNSGYYHQNYEKYDYSKYEKEE